MDVKKVEQSYIAGGNIIWCSCSAKIWCFPSKLNVELSYKPAILFWGIDTKELKHVAKQKFVHNVHISTNHITQNVGAIQMSINS